MASSARRASVVRDEILTLQDVADLLKVGLKTAYTMAQQGKLPGFKVGQQWRFKLGDINAWIDAQKAAIKKPQAKPRRRRAAA
jgi:excisionase family DNA binding protein